MAVVPLLPRAKPSPEPTYAPGDHADQRAAILQLTSEVRRIEAIYSGSFTTTAVKGRAALHIRNAEAALAKLRRAL